MYSKGEPLPVQAPSGRHVQFAYNTSERVGTGIMIEAAQNVTDFDEKDSFTSGLQEAVDALPKSGGIVWVPPGVYTLHRHVRLRSNVTIRGAGQSSRIVRAPEVSSPLMSEAQAGETSVHVESESEFTVGMEVSVFDKAQHGWYATHAFHCGHQRKQAPSGSTYQSSLSPRPEWYGCSRFLGIRGVGGAGL